ncbi:unnamed protein product, partial [Musa banksii]
VHAGHVSQAVLDRLEEPVTVEARPPPAPCATRSNWHSVETLVVVLAAITMAAVIAGCSPGRAAGGIWWAAVTATSRGGWSRNAVVAWTAAWHRHLLRGRVKPR